MCVRPRCGRVGAAAAIIAVLVAGLLGGCGAAGAPAPEPIPSPAASSTASQTAGPSIPTDGVTLRELGFTNGPVDTFSVPAGSVVTDKVDQPNAVTVVMSAPDTPRLAAYYRTALPAAGFTITADDRANGTLTFDGHGWTGVLTGSEAASAVALRPSA
jgi:hypothetical protein